MAAIRRLEPTDRPAVVELMDRFGEELAAMDPHGRVVRREGFGQYFVDEMQREARERDGIVLVAESYGRIVGFAAGGVREPDHKGDELSAVPFRNGRVTELYVEPASRRNKVGRALIAAIEDHFRTVGCGAVRIEVFAPNVIAREFYDHLGYEPRDIDLFKLLD